MTKPRAVITIPDVAPWIRDYYAQPGNSLGGSLHIVLEDANWEQSQIDWCERRAIERGDVFGAFLARVLGQMSGGQRRRLSRMNWYSHQ